MKQTTIFIPKLLLGMHLPAKLDFAFKYNKKRNFMMVLILSIFGILFFGCEKTPCKAPFNHNSSLEGSITFEDGTPDSIKADVQAYFQDQTILIAETQTDTTGYFFLGNLSSGEYQLNISATNYSDFSISNVILNQNGKTIIDTINMELIRSIEYREITVDGVIDDGWESVYENTHESSWSTTNDFENLYIARDNDSLYIAVDGGFDSGGNTVNIYIDKDYGEGTGINDFAQIQGEGYGDHLRKNISTPKSFGADIAYTGWALSSEIGIVNLEDFQNVDQHIIEETNISVNSSVIEFAIPFSVLYENGEIPIGHKIALVSIIGGGGDEYFADDTIPQQLEFTGIFMTVFNRAY